MTKQEVAAALANTMLADETNVPARLSRRIYRQEAEKKQVRNVTKLIRFATRKREILTSRHLAEQESITRTHQRRSGGEAVRHAASKEDD